MADQPNAAGRVYSGQDPGPRVRDLPAILRGDNARKAAGDAPVIPILLVAGGGYLIWFGIHYWRDQTVVLPSDPVKSLLQGKGLPKPDRGTTTAAVLTADEQSMSSSSSSGSSSGGGSAYQGSVAPGSAQNTARLLLGKYGWGPEQMPDLILLWNRESGWSATARNPSSGAYGVAQALGHGGTGTAAADGTNEYGAEYGLTEAEARAANAGSARWQIEWGLGYIKSAYGSPQAAWSHEESAGWY